MKEKLLVLTGPTGIGKTELSLKLANKLNGEIISADSMQIYRRMDIGTAKIQSSEMNGITHYLINIVEPTKDYSVAEFSKNAKSLITSINKKNKVPMLVGGTGLYINSVIYDLDLLNVKPDYEYRKFLEDLASKKGVNHLHEILLDQNKEVAQKIDKNNKNRIIRALEICRNGQGNGDRDFRKNYSDYKLAIFGLDMDRDKLYERINKRVDLMMEKGLIEEVKSLLESGCTEDSQSMKGIGYKEVIEYFKGINSYEKTVELIKQHSRNYAKRQLTWFRREERLKWINVNPDSNLDELADIIYKSTIKIFNEE